MKLRRISLLLLVCLLLGVVAQAEAPRAILYTAYEQQGWGDRVEAAFVDEQGGVWQLNGYASGMDWPGTPEAQVAWLPSAEALQPVGMLAAEDLAALNELIAAVEDQGRDLAPGMYLDYGVSSSYAVRYDDQGEPQCILLYAYGDMAFTNTDPNADALMQALALLFWGDGAGEAAALNPGGR